GWRRQGAGVDPVVPAQRPVPEPVGRFEIEAGVAYIDDVTRAEVVVEPDRVVGVDVDAAVRGVAVPLLAHAPRRGVHVLPRVRDVRGPLDVLRVVRVRPGAEAEAGRAHPGHPLVAEHHVHAAAGAEVDVLAVVAPGGRV